MVDHNGSKSAKIWNMCSKNKMWKIQFSPYTAWGWGQGSENRHTTLLVRVLRNRNSAGGGFYHLNQQGPFKTLKCSLRFVKIKMGVKKWSETFNSLRKFDRDRQIKGETVDHAGKLWVYHFFDCPLFTWLITLCYKKKKFMRPKCDLYIVIDIDP